MHLDRPGCFLGVLGRGEQEGSGEGYRFRVLLELPSTGEQLSERTVKRIVPRLFEHLPEKREIRERHIAALKGELGLAADLLVRMLEQAEQRFHSFVSV